MERLTTFADTIAPEAACTSVQFHLQVSPQQYAATWNAAQCIAGVQVALGANSPFLYGKELWRETRIALFEQATDTRPEELKAQGVRPRVWFGERWITSIFDQFEENVRYFPALLPIVDDEDPVEVLERGDTPALGELRMHNGTIYRWNRPVYDVVGGKPHLRVENRVLPAGPTVVDVLANAAFYYGLVRALVDAGPAAVDADLVHRRGGQLPRRGAGRDPRPRLLAGPRRGAGHRTGAAPAAADGPRGPGRLGRRRHDVVDRLLAVIEGRCIAQTQRRRVAGAGLPRHRRAEPAAGPPGRAARDAAPLHRAHAQQRAGAHLDCVVRTGQCEDGDVPPLTPGNGASPVRTR